jgi:prepilin-type N-terminal cleavage/methylation domain-containing protein
MRKRPEAEGFTLLEVLVSLAIMAIAMTLVIQLFSANLRAVVRSGDMTSAIIKGEYRLREILAEPFLTEKAWNEVTDDGYRIDVAVSEAMGEKTENLPVKLMEIALTVHWTDGLKEKSLRLKTMKVVDKKAPT